MICNESEYQAAVRRLGEAAALLAEHEARPQAAGLAADELQQALEPLRTAHQLLAEEIESYERVRRGDLGTITVLVPRP